MTFIATNTPKDAEFFPVFDNAGLRNARMGGVVPMDPSDITQISSKDAEFDPALAQRLARECYEASTTWIDSSRRGPWADSYAAFQGKHPSGSKYLSSDYRYRSRLFKPKTRSMVRKAEASTAQAFFANEDVVNISAQDENDVQQQASAKIMDRLLQYRLTKTIPWFQTLVGARQDAEVTGICIGKAYWKYKEILSKSEERFELDEFGNLKREIYDIYKKIEDHPWIDLLAVENFRFDPGADWRIPVSTSPYIIELIPMYIADAKKMVAEKKWLDVPEGAFLSATDIGNETTRSSRERDRVPGKDKDSHVPRDFDICWVHENIVRWEGEDMHYLTIHNTDTLLTNPVPLKEVYLHGVRPYVVGNVVTEAHKVYPTSKVELIRDLQTQTNDITNLRLDNIKLALNPRQFVKGGQGLDLQDLRTFMPGKTVVTSGKDDVRNVVIWDRPPDMTGSAYQESDRLNMDYDELIGGVSNSAVEANRQVYQAVGNMEMMAGNASVIEEYDQRVFAETFVEPIIRQLILLEQAYETDPVVLAVAGKEAQLWQRFGINEITDELLRQELTIKVNVGLGATNPMTRLQNFLTATKAVGEMYGPLAAMASNPEEVVSEIFGLCGYRDGKRFFQKDFDFKAAMANQPNADQQKMKIEEAKQQAQAKQDLLNHQLEMQQAQQEAKLKNQEMQMQFYYKMQELNMKYKMEMSKNEANSKPSTVVQFDANNALADVGKNLNNVAAHLMSSSDGVGQILSNLASNAQGNNLQIGALAQAIEKLAKPKKRRAVRDKDGKLIGAEEYE